MLNLNIKVCTLYITHENHFAALLESYGAQNQYRSFEESCTCASKPAKRENLIRKDGSNEVGRLELN